MKKVFLIMLIALFCSFWTSATPSSTSHSGIPSTSQIVSSDREIVDYVVVQSSVITELVTRVKSLINYGYQPWGTVIVINGYGIGYENGHVDYAQVMVKYSSNK